VQDDHPHDDQTDHAPHGPHHQHQDDGVTAVIVQPTPAVVTIQEKPVFINNNNLPPPVLPDNMV